MIERDKQYYSDKVDTIIDKIKSVELNKLTILTGPNGSGKSVLRQLLENRFTKELDIKKATASISMSLRTGGMGATRAFTSDTPWIPTSENTMHFIEMLFKSAKNRYIVIDEMEIGMTEEMQLTAINMINQYWTEHKEDYLGLMIITHSRFVVENLQCDVFMNMEDMTKDQWLNRPIRPVDLEQFKYDSHQLFLEITDRNENKK